MVVQPEVPRSAEAARGELIMILHSPSIDLPQGIHQPDRLILHLPQAEETSIGIALTGSLDGTTEQCRKKCIRATSDVPAKPCLPNKVTHDTDAAGGGAMSAEGLESRA